MRCAWNRSTVRGWIVTGLMLGLAGMWLADRAESQPAPRVAASGLFSVLKAKQSLAVREVAGRYELSLMPDIDTLSHEVVEVGADYIVVRDTGDVAQLRIPIYSIKAVITQQGSR
jgi:hypothetical protein